jgi:hypothetical protein
VVTIGASGVGTGGEEQQTAEQGNGRCCTMRKDFGIECVDDRIDEVVGVAARDNDIMQLPAIALDYHIELEAIGAMDGRRDGGRITRLSVVLLASRGGR